METFRHCQSQYGTTSTDRAQQIGSPVFYFILATTVRGKKLEKRFLGVLTYLFHDAKGGPFGVSLSLQQE